MTIDEAKQTLSDLGFTLVNTPTTPPSRALEMAVREFQRYARLPRVAREEGTSPIYSDRLRSRPNPHRYTGRVHGQLDTETLEVLELWKKASLRCPVVIESWVMKEGKTCTPDERDTIVDQNLWIFDEQRSPYRMFSVDFSGYYVSAPEPPAMPVREVIGYYEGKKGTGPNVLPPQHVWREPARRTEILPENFTGGPLTFHASPPTSVSGCKRADKQGQGPPTEEDVRRSTYRVLRAVAEVECLGYFDVINAWDAAVVSLGPCHWTLNIGRELSAYMAFLQYRDTLSGTNAFDKAVGGWGLEPFKKNQAGDPVNWIADPTGKLMFDPTIRTYTGWWRQRVDAATDDWVAEDAGTRNFLRSWHWIYRWQMAARTIPAFRLGMWDFARVRIRDILNVRFPSSATGVPNVPGPSGPIKARLGQVFTSELAVALLLRWHINQPAGVVSGGLCSPHMVKAVTHAKIKETDLKNWSHREEQQLLDGLRKAVDDLPAGTIKTNLIDTMARVRSFPSKGLAKKWCFSLAKPGRLATCRHSFLFDGRSLPDPPTDAGS